MSEGFLSMVFGPVLLVPSPPFRDANVAILVDLDG
jgi:hypothetical protein